MHIWDIKPDQVVEARISAVISEVFILLSATSLKISILCLYQRVGFRPWSRHILIILFSVVSLWALSQCLALFMQCIPLHDYWDLSNSPGSICVNETTFLVAYATTNMILDIIIYIIPFPVLYRLGLPRRQKIILAVNLSIGGM